MAEIFYQDEIGTLYCGDTLEVLSELPGGSVQTSITAPPYCEYCKIAIDRILKERDKNGTTVGKE